MPRHPGRPHNERVHRRHHLADGTIGGPVSLRVNSGGGPLNIASHLVDNMRWCVGDPDREFVVGWIQRDTNRIERGSYAEEKTNALISFEGGSEMLLTLDMEDGVKNHVHQFTGPDGVITFTREEAVLLDAEGLHEPLAIEAGELPCDGEPYDIPIDEALEYAIETGHVS